MTNNQDSQASGIPSFEQLVTAQIGAERLAQVRAQIPSDGTFGNPRGALGVGDSAPAFALQDTSGKTFALAELLRQGPVVAIFYRGGWCPYCNVQLRAFQLARTRLRALGASVVLISPQRAEEAFSMAEQNTLQFPMLIDSGNQVAHRYGLSFQINHDLRDAFRAGGIDLAQTNGDESWQLPMPATFVIDRSGVIQFAFVSADYTRRAEPSDVITTLQRMNAITRI